VRKEAFWYIIFAIAQISPIIFIMMNQIIPTNDSPLALFDDLAAQVERTVAPSSARIYRQTFGLWRRWCEANAVFPLDMRPATVTEFLASQDTTKATRQRQLSALRKLAQMAYILYPTDETRRYYEALKLIKAPVSADTVKRERTKRALAPREADKLLRVWDGEMLADKRNAALVAVLLLGGIRRSEAAALHWDDVDFDNGILHIRHGKGDKSRDVPLAGDYVLEALAAWQERCVDREYIFCPVERNNHLGKDKPITGTDVYRIWDATGKQAGVESKPHDARRTFITEALATGTPIATVQAIAGHARGETTLRYARSVDARRAREELKLRYG
jgi:integrase/recombinase XerD